MTARDYINSIEKEGFEIDKCLNKIERLEVLAENRSSRRYDNDRIQSSGSKDRIGDLTVKISMEKDRLMTLIERNEAKREYFEKQIDRIDDLDYQRIIYYRHLDNMRYEDIADLLDLSPQTVQNKHSKAMKELFKVFVVPELEDSRQK